MRALLFFFLRVTTVFANTDQIIESLEIDKFVRGIEKIKKLDFLAELVQALSALKNQNADFINFKKNFLNSSK